MHYYEFTNNTDLECHNCHWKGKGEDAPREPFDVLFEIWCPACNTKLFNVLYPTPQETKEAARQGNREAAFNEIVDECVKEKADEFRTLILRAKQLVRERITGNRKGLDSPAYLHSFRVYELVFQYGGDATSFEARLAALLHDIVEDGGISLEELRRMGFPDRTIELVDLCTHPLHVQDSTARWILMIARLVEADDEDAWRIKLADLTDNLSECDGLSPKNRQFMVEVKAPILLRLTEDYAELETLRERLESSKTKHLK